MEEYRNKRQVGSSKEQMASDYLSRAGVTILEKNYRCKKGEIDLVGEHNGYLVFFEVKYRRDNNLGGALAAVDLKKQKRICAVADHYRFLHRCTDSTMIRYDVVGITGEEITWIPNAFPHRTGGMVRNGFRF